MRVKISVRVSKFLLTLLRNMRRRRKTRSIPSPFPVVLLFGLIVLLRYLNVSSLANNFRDATQGLVADATTKDVDMVQAPGAGHQVGHQGVSEEKRREVTERRHAERRATHRRIAEQQRREAEETRSRVSQRDNTEAVAERPIVDSRAKESHEIHHETSSGNDAIAGHERHAEGAKSTKNTHTQKNALKSSVKRESTKEPTQVIDTKNPEKPKMTEVRMTSPSEKRDDTGNGSSIPAGARVHGKQPEFGGSLGGSTDGMIRGQNITRVSYTLFKIMKLFGFVSMVDSLAGSHTEWMPEVVERMSFDHPSFQYTAVDDTEGIERARTSMGDLVDGEYVVSNVEERTANESDVVFHWTELDGGARDARAKGYMEHIRRVMLAAKKGNNGYIVFGQFPRLNGPQPTYRKGKWVFVGEKEEPFLYNEHVRGVVPMGNGRESYMMYMTFYSLRSIRMTELQA